MRIAAAQAHPAWGRPDEGADRVAGWIARAAGEGVDLLAFGETHLGGYPFWLSGTGGARFEDPDQKRAYAYYLDVAVELDGPELRRVVEAAAEHRVFTYLGVAERDATTARGSVYATLVAIDPRRGIVSAHRKVQPTYEERLAWAAGDGHGLRVHEVSGREGDRLRVGGLNCWENWLPQARLALYAEGEDVHVSAWPGSSRLTRDITRFVAREGRVYSLAAGSLLSRSDIPDDFPLAGQLETGDWADGGGAIAAPDGTWLQEPASADGLVVADVDAARVREERQNFDPAGHYGRPDIFSLRVDRRRRRVASFSDDAEVDEEA
jgi:nitrilase